MPTRCGSDLSHALLMRPRWQQGRQGVAKEGAEAMGTAFGLGIAARDKALHTRGKEGLGPGATAAVTCPDC